MNPGRQACLFRASEETTPSPSTRSAAQPETIAFGAQAIKAGDAEVVISGGMESMSTRPYALPNARWGYRMNMPNARDGPHGL